MDRLSPVVPGAGLRARPHLLLPFLLLAAGCGERSTPSPPPPLLGGLHAGWVPTPLRGLHGQSVTTRVRVLTARPRGPALVMTCVRRVGPVALGRSDRVVERIGVAGASITFAGRPPGWIRGCDATAPLSRSSWCGGAVGRTRADGTLFDPRLDVACRDGKGRKVGFAWIDPLPGARYVTVRDGDYTEIYRTAAGLPVRVTTHDVSEQQSSAVFRVAQYAAKGRRLSEESLHAVVAG